MIYPITIGVISFVAFLCQIWFKPKHWDDNVDRLLTSLAAFGVAGAIAFALSAGIWGVLYPYSGAVRHTTQYSLINLQDNSTSSGQFFLGIGQVDGNLSVNFYVSEHGYAEPNTVSSADNDVHIYQDLAPGQTPYVKQVITGPHFWTGSLYNGALTPDLYDFHVAPGTIKQDFTLDAK